MRSGSARIWLTVVALSILASLVGASRPARAELTFEVVKSFELPERAPGALVLGSDGALYGTTLRGGSADAGTIFRIDSDGTYTRLHSFNGTDGIGGATLVLGRDGALYGITQSGFFRIDNAGNFTIVHAFDGTTLLSPSALVLGSDGAFYGTTRSGGSSGYGMVFRIDSDGTFASLHSFRRSDGANPGVPLVLGSDGALYGTTPDGGSFNRGTVFRIDSAGNFTSLHSFSGTEGAVPVAALVLGDDGALYGTTRSTSAFPSGSVQGAGTVFRIDEAGNFTSLHTFGGTEGAYLTASLVLGGDGALYGTAPYTYESRPYGYFGVGTVFRIDGAGNFTPLHSFSGPDGAIPFAPLVLGSDGAFYGTTTRGGSPGALGTVFRIDSAGTFTSLHSFSGSDGYGPTVLVLGRDGALYGVTDWDGYYQETPQGYALRPAGANGTVFRIDEAGTFTTLHLFLQSADGFFPQPVLAVGGDGAVYGATYSGGALRAGTLFKVEGAGGFTSLHDFSFGDLGGNGPPPYYFPPQGTLAALARGGDGAVYGITPYGGESGAGALFKVDSAGTFNFVHSWGGSFGTAASASLVLGSDGTLYGSGHSVFQIDSAGVFTSLVESFDTQRCEALGQYPMNSYSGPVARGSDGLVYGVNALFCGYGEGGVYQYDAIFRRDDAGTLDFFHSFADSDYTSPTALVAGSDGALYGKRHGGGGSGGSIFRLDSTGHVTTVQSFPAYGSGPSPYAPLVLGSDGALYGTTLIGGASNLGSIFRINAAANFSIVHSFGSADGGYPIGPLALANNGSIYGTTWFGGASNAGTVFKVDSAGTFTSVYSYTEDPVGQGHFVVAGEACALYGVATGGPAGGGIVYRLFEAGHLCQHVDFDPLPDHTFGDPPFMLSATASSGLPVSFTASGSCKVTGETVSVTGAGLCTLTASQAGDADYEPAPEVSRAFHVYFDFAGFLPPVEGPPAVNRVDAGRVVPIAFGVAEDPGPGVFERALVRRVDCDTLQPEGGFEPAASPGAALRGATSSGRYAFPWKTEKTWTGSCRELALELADGSLHQAYFRFGDHPRSQPHAGRH